MNFSLHLQAALQWLAQAQDARREDRGISAAYHLLRGWLPSYPETTGYIINTFLGYERRRGDKHYASRATEAGEWLVRIQLPSGAFPGGYGGPQAEPRVFNTGMVLFGLSELAGMTHAEHFVAAGRRALDWLVTAQDADGSWTTIAPERQPHAYHSRVAWGMVDMAQHLPPEVRAVYRQAAQKAGGWVLTQQAADGWFRSNDLIHGLPPLTHNIAYVLRGLLELGVVLGCVEFIQATERAAEPLRRDWEIHGHLAVGYGPRWERGPSFRCVTGEAQLGLIWLRLWQLTGEKRYRRAAEGVARQVAETQWLFSSIPTSIYGGIPGAWPLWGRYLRWAYPNWAAKFFADLLMLLEEGSSD